MVATVACGDDDESSPGTSVPAPVISPSSTTPETTGGADAPAGSASPAADGPIGVEHQYGTTEIPATPERIVSASITMTGPLLAIDAPVVASAATGASKLADEQGFFIQWADVAAERNVEAMPGAVNIEAIAALDPDLIVGSAFGGDAVTEDIYALLSVVAATVVIDHSALNVGELTAAVGQATGRDADADAVIADLEAHIAEVAPGLDTSTPVAPVSIADAGGLNVLTPVSAHGQLLASLGYTIKEVEATTEGELGGAGARQDVVSLSAETLDAQLGDSTLFFIFAEQAEVDAATDAIPTLAALPAVVEGRAYPLGYDSFRLDPFSANDVIDAIAAFAP